jgi:hypothetical protein
MSKGSSLTVSSFTGQIAPNLPDPLRLMCAFYNRLYYYHESTSLGISVGILEQQPRIIPLIILCRSIVFQKCCYSLLIISSPRDYGWIMQFRNHYHRKQRMMIKSVYALIMHWIGSVTNVKLICIKYIWALHRKYLAFPNFVLLCMYIPRYILHIFQNFSTLL